MLDRVLKLFLDLANVCCGEQITLAHQSCVCAVSHAMTHRVCLDPAVTENHYSLQQLKNCLTCEICRSRSASALRLDKGS